VADSHVDDDGLPSAPFIAVEESDRDWPQALWVSIDTVFDTDAATATTTARAEPGVWVEYQPQYGHSDLQGPLLFSVATWRELNAAVERRLEERGL